MASAAERQGPDPKGRETQLELLFALHHVLAKTAKTKRSDSLPKLAPPRIPLVLPRELSLRLSD
jgi:hypothetical protein